MINEQRSNSGFSMIEAVMATFFVSLCMVIVVNLFIGQNRIYRTETAELNITNDARRSLDDIGAYVRQSHRALASYSSFTGGTQVLILQIKAIDGTNTIIPGVYDYAVYYLTGTDLFREVFPDGASARVATLRKLASNVNGLTFTYNNASYPLVTAVTTDLTLEEDAGIQNRSITISSKATLRGY